MAVILRSVDETAEKAVAVVPNYQLPCVLLQSEDFQMHTAVVIPCNDVGTELYLSEGEKSP